MRYADDGALWPPGTMLVAPGQMNNDWSIADPEPDDSRIEVDERSFTATLMAFFANLVWLA